jgi:hypothetical protein
VRSQHDDHQGPQAVILEGIVISPRQWRFLLRQRRAVWVVVGLVAAAQILRYSRLDRKLIVSAIVLRALAEMGWKNLVSSVMWLNAWQKSRIADLEKERRRRPVAKADQPEPAGTDTPGEGPRAASG